MILLIILSALILGLGLFMIIRYMEEGLGYVGLCLFVLGGAGVIVFLAIANVAL